VPKFTAVKLFTEYFHHLCIQYVGNDNLLMSVSITFITPRTLFPEQRSTTVAIPVTNTHHCIEPSTRLIYHFTSTHH